MWRKMGMNKMNLAKLKRLAKNGHNIGLQPLCYVHQRLPSGQEAVFTEPVGKRSPSGHMDEFTHPCRWVLKQHGGQALAAAYYDPKKGIIARSFR